MERSNAKQFPANAKTMFPMPRCSVSICINIEI